MKLKSFTLIELVTVVSIVGVLSGIMVYGVNDWKDKAYMDEVAAYSNNIKNKIGGTLVAEWKMEGIETALLYDSGRLGITGTTGGTLTKVNNCPEGNNCINSNVANVSFSNSQKFSTVCFWIKPTATSVDILERTNDFKIYTTSGIVSFNIYYADATYNTVTYTGKNIYDNKWHYVCGSLNSDETFVGTIDGDVFASETVNVDSFNRGSSMCLGCSANSLFYMDDLVLFAGSLEKGLLVSTTVINGTCGAAARTYITETDYDGLESFCETGNVSSFPSFPDL
ncbi:MAG: hypothetical protein PHF88_00240 [Candidatus Pacebacteria bacterium]|nr:hypothetical protein [Candidatus Paceibacterota bacterium]